MDKQIKIAIITHKMVMGGIEKSLLELINELKNKNFEVTVYIDELGGELYEQLISIVQVIHIFRNQTSTFDIIKKSLAKKQIKKVILAIYIFLANLLHFDPVRTWKITARNLDEFNGQYDYAFAYGSPISFSTIFTDVVLDAKKKFVWIHNDVNEISLSITKYRNIFDKYNKIICVSASSKKNFLDNLPEYRYKTMVLYNFINKKKILKESECKIDFSFNNSINLLTVGRISHEKGQDIIPQLTNKLVTSGYNARWYCIGDGENKIQISKEIKRLGMESRVILLGNKYNPYPYYKMADIYVQPSRHEGFGITISEAKIFNLAIITTDFDSADEQITDGETGFIVPFDEEIFYKKIVELIENKSLKEKFIRNLKNDNKNCNSVLSELFI